MFTLMVRVLWAIFMQAPKKQEAKSVRPIAVFAVA